MTPVLAERADRLASHVAAALHNAREHEQIFLLPLLRAVGLGLSTLRGRRLAQAMAALAIVLATILMLAFVPATYRVEGKGRLMPALQRDVFAPWDGEVTEVLVRGGERVQPGQPLLRLRNDDLQTQHLAARNRLAEQRQVRVSLQAEIDRAARQAAGSTEIVRLRGRLAQTDVEIEGLQKRADALEEQIDALTVRAPITGTVATFRAEQQLLNRPVRRGDVLVELMDESGDWQLEIDVSESRMGHVLAACGDANETSRPVEFVLATVPERTFAGTLRELATRSRVTPDQQSVVTVHVALDTDQLPHRRIGAEVQAKIDCGSRSLGYVLFGDVVEFIQRRLW